MARADSLTGRNTELRFYLDSDSSLNYQGMAIDDVRVTGCFDRIFASGFD